MSLGSKCVESKCRWGASVAGEQMSQEQMSGEQVSREQMSGVHHSWIQLDIVVVNAIANSVSILLSSCFVIDFFIFKWERYISKHQLTYFFLLLFIFSSYAHMNTGCLKSHFILEKLRFLRRISTKPDKKNVEKYCFYVSLLAQQKKNYSLARRHCGGP
jgi:hypothetical protein